MSTADLISYAVQKALAGKIVVTITVRSPHTKGIAIHENQMAMVGALMQKMRND